MEIRLIPCWLLLWFWQILATQGETSDRTERGLVAHLLKDYQRSARPVRDPNSTVHVKVYMELVTITELDEREQIFKTFAWLNLEWTDEYLVWDKDDWNGVDVIAMENVIWNPDVVVLNSADNVYGAILDEERTFRPLVSSDGRVNFWTAGEIKTSCRVDMTYFPFDDQACFIDLNSWIYVTDQLDLEFPEGGGLGLKQFRKSGEWNVLDSEVRDYDAAYDTWKFSHAYFFLYLRRKPLYYIYNIIIPSIVLSFLVLFVFLLPADSGEKIGLGITLLLSFSVFQLMIADSMPQTSDFTPLIGIYTMLTMGMTALSLAASVGVLSIHHHFPDSPVPAGVRAFVRVSRRLLCMRPAREPPAKELTSPDTVKAEWADAARVVDRALFVVFLGMLLVETVVILGVYPLTKPAKPDVLGLSQDDIL